MLGKNRPCNQVKAFRIQSFTSQRKFDQKTQEHGSTFSCNLVFNWKMQGRGQNCRKFIQIFHKYAPVVDLRKIDGHLNFEKKPNLAPRGSSSKLVYRMPNPKTIGFSGRNILSRFFIRSFRLSHNPIRLSKLFVSHDNAYSTFLPARTFLGDHVRYLAKAISLKRGGVNSFLQEFIFDRRLYHGHIRLRCCTIAGRFS